MGDASCGPILSTFVACACSAQETPSTIMQGVCIATFSASGALEKALSDCVTQSCASECLLQ
jgi:hypothetical protein